MASVRADNISSRGVLTEIFPENNPSAHQIGRFGSQPCGGSNPKMSDDDFSTVLLRAQENQMFCRAITALLEPLFIIASEQQLRDLRRFAVGVHAEPITLDPTFNLGNFYVTAITFKNLFLQNKAGTNACFCGPLLIHYTKTGHTYSEFFRRLTEIVPDLFNVSVFGTDGEIELIKSLRTWFPDAKALRCFLHIEKKFRMKFSSLGVASEFKFVVEQLKNILLNSNDQFDVKYMGIVNHYKRKCSALSTYLLQRQDCVSKCVHGGNTVS